MGGKNLNKALIIDDEKRMLDLIELYLIPHRYKVTKALGALEALTYIEKESFDIILLDIMMPEVSGWEFCQRVRDFSDVPIIMVTARDQTTDIIKGLQMGADDYMTKPFDENELLARMNALLRRRTPNHMIKVNGLCWNRETFEVTYQNQKINLTPKEFLMLGYFLKHPNRIFGRNKLIELIWGFNSEIKGRTVDSHVRNMREKIRQAGFPIDDYFQTVWGIGYIWKDKCR